MKNYFFVITSLIIWSSYGIILKKFPVNPVIFTFLTTSVGWFFIFAYIKFRKISITVSHKHKLYLFIITIFFLINSITFFYSYRLTSVSNAIFSHYLAPVFVSLLSPMLINEKIERITFIALFVAIFGMYFIFFPEGFKIILSEKDILGVFLGIISALCYGLLIVTAKHLLNKLEYLVLMFYQGLFTFIIFLISYPFVKKLYIFDFNTLKIILLVGFIHSFLSPILYLKGLKYIKAQFAGLLGYTEVVGSLILGMIFLKETPSIMTMIGGSLIVVSGGMVIVYGGKT